MQLRVLSGALLQLETCALERFGVCLQCALAGVQLTNEATFTSYARRG